MEERCGLVVSPIRRLIGFFRMYKTHVRLLEFGAFLPVRVDEIGPFRLRRKRDSIVVSGDRIVDSEEDFPRQR
jgi:hypothetical protein